MPQVKIKGVEEKEICLVSKELVDELQELLQCPRNYFVLERINSTFIMDGNYVKAYPIIEVAWFDRGQELQDEVAKIITKHIQNLGYTEVDVIFTLLEEKNYYENGKHF
jgi:hypothetical protein